MFFNIPQIQYKNPWVQIMLFRNMTPSPFLRFYLGEWRAAGGALAVSLSLGPAPAAPGKELLHGKELEPFAAPLDSPARRFCFST